MTDPRTVLLVDDDQSFRRVMEYQLHEDGYRVLTAANVAAALQHFKAETIDVVMTDVKMPGADGMELLARLKAMQPDLPVVMLTAHGTIGAAVEAMKCGAFDYLTKPFTREQLRIALSKTFDVAALKRENRRLREVVAERFSFANMIAESRAMHDVDGYRVTRGADRHDRAARRRERHGQGTARQSHSLPQRSRKDTSVRRRQLRGDSREPARIRAVRPSPRIVHGRDGRQAGQVRGRQRRHDLPRRNRRAAVDDAGQDSPRAAEAARSTRWATSGPRRSTFASIAATNRDLEKMVADGSVSRRSVLSARRRRHPHAAPPGARRTTSRCWSSTSSTSMAPRLGRPPAPSLDATSIPCFNLYCVAWKYSRARECRPARPRARLATTSSDWTICLSVCAREPRSGAAADGTARRRPVTRGRRARAAARGAREARLESDEGRQRISNISRSALIYRMQKFALERPGATEA